MPRGYIFVLTITKQINKIMENLNTINEVKNLFKNNFTNLFDGKLIELNEATIKVNASYDDGEGSFTQPELILNAFDNHCDEDALATMIEAINEDWVEVEFKKNGDDYIITAGNQDNIYVIKLQVIRIN